MDMFGSWAGYSIAPPHPHFMTDPSSLDPPDVQAINTQASKLMKRGIALLDEGRHDAAAQALVYFDRALEMRLTLPYHADPILRFGLAACWLNRADALARLGDRSQVAAALAAYDEGIVVLRDLPMADDPRFPRRLAIAHQNRGLALQAQGAARLADAIASFEHAIAVLDGDQGRAIPDRPYLLATVSVNLASARVSEETTASDSLARAAALRAMDLMADVEVDDADAAEVGLKARHVLCRTVARRLSEPAAGADTMPPDVHEATDAVDDGLGLARKWEQKGVARFRSVAVDLFRFGALVYARYQPHFLDEFIRENLDPARSSIDYVESDEIQSAAREAQRLLGG
jgi:tetratricopeptide (TPR) repeat protein